MERAPISERSHDSQNKDQEQSGEHQYEILYSPAIRAEYLRLTDQLIAKMVEQKTDVGLFLDKSARPVAWMVKELWPILAPIDPETNEQYKLPDIKFVNIDRETMGTILGRSEDKLGGIDIDLLPSERVEELQDVFAPVVGISEAGDTSVFTGKKVMIVDELRQSGDTLVMAEKIVERAFPDAAEVEASYWMHGKIIRDSKSGALIGESGPVWYSDREVTGRLVGNRNSAKSAASSSRRQQRGKFWLGSPFEEKDYKGLRLKREVEWLAEDLSNNKLIYMPSLDWTESSPEPLEQRIERINGISKQEYITLRQEADDTKDFNNMYRDYLEAKKQSY